MAKWGLEVGLTSALPTVVIKVDEIEVKRPRRFKDAGMFVIVNRDCGLALDAGTGMDGGRHLEVQPLNASRRQLWHLRPAGANGEVLVSSADNGMVLDATSAWNGDMHPVLWPRHSEPWQRWRLAESPDGAAYFIETAHGRECRFLALNNEAAPGWSPWFEARTERQGLHWVVAQPFGLPPK